LSPLFATQTAVGEAATAAGWAPTGMEETSLLAAMLIRAIEPSVPAATHTS